MPKLEGEIGVLEEIPKVISAENVAGILKIEFDNGKVKYLKTNYSKDLVDAYSIKNGKKKRTGLLYSQSNAWVGTSVVVNDDGEVLLDKNEKYTSDYLWNQGVNHIDEL